MARIRTIKPDAFKSDSLSMVPRGTRWTFSGLWTYADDQGRGRDDVRLIKAELYPIDDTVSLTDLAEDLRLLAAVDCICRYEVGGKAYLHMPNWGHQRINRPTASKLPPCGKEHSTAFQQPLPPPSPTPHAQDSEDSREEGNREQGSGTGKGKGSKRGAKVACQIPAGWTPKPEHQEIATEYGLDAAFQSAKFLNHFQAKGTRYKDWDHAYRNWLVREKSYLEERQERQQTKTGNGVNWDEAMKRADERTGS
jgi:hypothetical protein